MLTPPDDLPDDVLSSALVRGWGVSAASMAYRPVGFGSHHWEVVDTAGTRWFVTVDELDAKRHSWREPLDVAYGRLRASLAAARGLRDHGYGFVVAPVPAGDGEPVARAGDRYAIALYPFLGGQSFQWGEFSTPAHRQAVLDLVVALHTAPSGAYRPAMVDGAGIPYRDELEATLDGDSDGGTDSDGDLGTGTGDLGPYARPTARLVAEHAAPIRRLLARYDDLAAQARAQPDRAVLTHGEPHPGNTMRTPDGWQLIDWDTALVAQPERDVWSLDPGDGSAFDAYARATGVTPQPSMLELFAIRWDLADIAMSVHGFRRHHTGTANDDESFEILSDLIARLAA
jgi:spectinomycin phosphotransferase/16S rRNA (guanine(1405)-N(7))-methyltransferase